MSTLRKRLQSVEERIEFLGRTTLYASSRACMVVVTKPSAVLLG
jgi:hypothetical protein